MNTVNIMGRISTDIKRKNIQTKDGQNKLKIFFMVAVDRKYSEETDFMPVVAFGKKAENICNFCKKGELLGISGSIQTYQSKDYKNSGWQIVAEDVDFMGRNKYEKNYSHKSQVRRDLSYQKQNFQSKGISNQSLQQTNVEEKVNVPYGWNPVDNLPY